MSDILNAGSQRSMTNNESKAVMNSVKQGLAVLAVLAVGLSGALLASTGCGEFEEPSDELQTANPQLSVFFNSPGFRDGSEFNRKPSEFISERIDNADVSVYAAVYGFSKQNIIDALVRAHYRGVEVRLVGDAGEYSRGSHGYATMEEHQIPVQTGNQFHIMHNKFFILDDRFVYTGTGNISDTEFTFNNNHWIWFDSTPVAERFTQEFEQMFEGRFSAAKQPLDSPKKFNVGGTEVEIWFAPQDDAMGRILEELRDVQESIYFQIFAFTKDQVASEFINRHREGKEVQGIIDRSQLHGNGQYHQGYRLLANGIDMRLDGNYNSRTPGDYQAGGGRLHTKTMFLDSGTDNARVLTGSFNWSSAATISNDEVLIIMRGEDVTDVYHEEYDNIWQQAKDLSTSMCRLMKDSEELRCDHREDGTEPGDVVISEVHFDGWNAQRDPTDHTGDFEDRDPVTNDQFVELYNTTDEPINMSMWTLTNGHDVKVGFPPGTVIGPGEKFLMLDHNTVPLSEGDPQRGNHAFRNPDFVLNTANDPRFRSLDLQSASLNLELRSTRQTGDNNETEIIDVAGNGGPPFVGGRDGDMNYSMQRIIEDDDDIGRGDLRGSWQLPQVSQGGSNVNPEFRDFIIAQPGE